MFQSTYTVQSVLGMSMISIDNGELNEKQKEALKSSGLGRSASSNWSATGGSSDDDEIYEMVFDSDGNVIVCGTIFSTSQFGATVLYTEGLGDIF